MNIRVHLFARARDLAGAPTVTIDLAGDATVAALRGALVESVPDLAAIASSLHVAINGNYADDSSLIAPKAEVACFPPVSGG